MAPTPSASANLKQAAYPGSHVAPLFWHHGERPEAVIDEIEAMHSAGIREFIVEPRPHPDYLGERWWSDMNTVVAAARQRQMRVWFFDDARFPSGWLNGEIGRDHPLRKRYLAERHVDVQGPLPSASFALAPWREDGDKVHAVIAVRRPSDDQIDSASLIDVSNRVHDDTLHWSVPDGRWRVVIILETSRGQEPETADYLNPIAQGAAELHLATVHLPHYERFQADFGRTVAGFFQDEPRFGNAKTYEFKFGNVRERVWGLDNSYVLPYSELLEEALDARWGEESRLRLPLLWWPGDDDLTAHTRYGYMDEVTRLYERFQRSLGDWCQERGVALIGHVVEDNGAHARLGYGAGHYFRAMAGQHMGGIDIVQHVQPGATGGRRAGSFGNYDDDFYYWGLAKLASSAAHIDPRKHGMAMCEAFGAYGWHEGLRLMKLLTDHMAVRGINYLVPHAFSAKRWDPDCPPHFYNGGLNPQWKHFAIWEGYAERISARLSGGRHIADAAVLYHAEAEWAGDYQPFERVLAELMKGQLDADVVPIDAVLQSEVLGDGSIRIGDETYPLLVVPRAERLPADILRFLVSFAPNVLFVDALPIGIADRRDPQLLQDVALRARVVPLAGLRAAIPRGVSASGMEPDLRVMRYDKDGIRSVFVVNESLHNRVDTILEVEELSLPVVSIDLLEQQVYAVDGEVLDGRTRVPLRLEPGESRLLSTAGTDEVNPSEPRWSPFQTFPLQGWKISTRSFDAEVFSAQGFTDLGPVNTPGRLPRFSGTIRYEKYLDLSDADAVDLGVVGETAQVWMDDVPVGTRVTPPYRFETHGRSGEVNVVVEVTTTLASKMAHGNVFDAAVALEPTGLIGPITAERRIS